VEELFFGRRYRATEKIGTGGMADVYKAVDETLGRTVAVKVMHARFAADPSFADLRGLAVSAHFLVRRDGRVLQFVSCNARAWHAGLSRFEGREQCNDFSVGIEMEGSDFVAFSPAQYESLAALTLALAARYRLAAVQGHEHVAPGRKTDPGPFFDWKLFAAELAGAAARLPENDAVLVPAHRLIGLISAMINVKAADLKK